MTTKRRIAIFVAVFFLAALTTIGMKRGDAAPAHDSPKRLCFTQYDYPGCTVQQQRSLEATTRNETNTNYNRHRWGQSNNEWGNLSASQDDRLRALYYDAVAAYDGIVRFDTWASFKTHSDCIGMFAGAPPAVPAWCQVNAGINNAFQPVQKFVLRCGGTVLGGLLAGGFLAAPNVYAIPEGAVIGAGAGALECAGENLWNRVWNLGPGKRQQAHRTYRIAERAWASIVPFGAVG